MDPERNRSMFHDMAILSGVLFQEYFMRDQEKIHLEEVCGPHYEPPFAVLLSESVRQHRQLLENWSYNNEEKYVKLFWQDGNSEELVEGFPWHVVRPEGGLSFHRQEGLQWGLLQRAGATLGSSAWALRPPREASGLSPLRRVHMFLTCLPSGHATQ